MNGALSMLDEPFSLSARIRTAFRIGVEPDSNGRTVTGASTFGRGHPLIEYPIDDSASMDFVFHYVSPDRHRLNLHGLTHRASNNLFEFRLFPSRDLDDLIQTSHSELVDYLTPSGSRDSHDSVSMLLKAGESAAVISVPKLVAQADGLGRANMRFEPPLVGPLIDIPAVTGVSSSEFDQTATTAAKSSVYLTATKPLVITCQTAAAGYEVVVRPHAPTDFVLALLDGTLRIDVAGDTSELDLTVHLLPVEFRRRWADRPNAVLPLSNLTLMFCPPFVEAHFAKTVACWTADPFCFPHIIPRTRHPNFPIPNTILFYDDYVAAPSRPRRSTRTHAIIFGVPDDMTLGLIAEHWDCVLFALTSKSEMTHCLNAFGVEIADLAHDAADLMTVARGERLVGGVVLEAGANFIDQVERFLLSAASLRPQPFESGVEHPPDLVSRLPALPVLKSRDFALISYLANLHRGRLSATSWQVDDAMDALTRDAGWLVPFTEPSSDDVELMFGLLMRVMSDYVALQIQGDMLVQVSADTDIEVGESHLATWLPEYVLQWLMHIDDPFIAPHPKLPEDLSPGRELIASPVTATAIAREIYSLDVQLRVQVHVRLLGATILALDSDLYDEDDSAIPDVYWLSYAGGLSRIKPCVLVLSMADESRIRDLRNLQTDTRLLFHRRDRAWRDSVASQRHEQSRMLREMLNPAALRLLETCGSDTVVAIADVALDFAPYAGGYLGLHFPIVRYPAGMYSMTTVGGAPKAAYARQLGLHATTALILTSSSANDYQAEWAGAMAREVSGLCRQFGLVAATSEGSDRDSVLQDLSKARIIFFFGHAAASEDYAFLEVGDVTIGVDDLRDLEVVAGAVVVLVGCETAASDANAAGDLALEFLAAGAYAVAGTSSTVSVELAQVFFRRFLSELQAGFPLEQAFFHARRLSAIYETLGQIRATPVTFEMAAEACGGAANDLSLSEVCDRAGILEEDVLKHATYALAFSMLGGVGEPLA